MSVQVGRRRWARRREASPDEGAAVLEYVGIVVAIAALMISLVAGFTPIGKNLGQKVCEAVASLTGGSCASTSAEAPVDRRPTKPCVRNTTETGVNMGGSISVIDLSSGKKIVREDLADGTVRVTIIDTDKIGATATAGEAGARLTIGGYGGAAGVSASASAALTGVSGAEYMFRSAEEATEFQEWMARELGRAVARQAGGPVIGAGIDIASWLYDKITGNGYRPPVASAIFGEASAVVSAQAMAEIVTAGVRGDVSVASGSGVRRDSDGNITVYTRMTLNAQAAANLGMRTLADGSVGVETIVAVTVNASGNVTEVGFTGAASGEGSYNLTRLVSADAPEGAAGRGVGINATLRVDDRNRARVLQALAAMGAVQIAGNPAMGQAAAVTYIIEEAKREGTLTAQTYDVRRRDLFAAALALKVPVLGGVSLSGDSSTSRRTSTGGWYWDGDGWRKWEECS